ncbi:hypothetical protein REPUB_Repub05bG0109400 [Reevesia pubescens]
MCSLTPFPTPNWPLVNPIGYEQKYINEGNGSVESFLHFPSPQEEVLLVSRSPSPFTQTSFDPYMVKKLDHNASERDRRKKVNSLYSSLRSLLPEADQMKKLSFPATVSHALKYIPELQEQVERLVMKKEEHLLRISQQADGLEEQQRKSRINGRSLSSAAVSINRLSDSEVAIQIWTRKVEKTQLSEILHYLEAQQGFLLLNATSFESFGGMVFYNIHLQVELEITSHKLESDEGLSEKLLSLCDDIRIDFLTKN